MGITSLTSNPLCCIIIVKGKQRNLFVESGIDVTATPVGDVSDDQFFEQNFGKTSTFLEVRHAYIMVLLYLFPSGFKKSDR